ncbi:MAG: hypothetical protein ACRD1T_24250 [Acidimicrobiia bacterium]
MTDTITKGGSSPSKATSKKKLIAIVAAVLVAGGLAVPAAIFGPQLLGIGETSQDAGANAPAGPAAGAQPGQFTEWRNDQVGIAMSYPANWVQLKADNPGVLLLASDGPENSFVVRSVELVKPIGQPELAAAKQETDQVIASNKTAKMIAEPKQIEMGGLPGFWYLYSFKDETSGQIGAHSHFFLFKGRTMITLVFQALPVEKFQQSAPVFDQITSSFRVLK